MKTKSTSSTTRSNKAPVSASPSALQFQSLAQPRPRPRGSILTSLGVVGMDHLEPVVLAVLASESPILLIGPHGTAKSLLLLRLSEALGLTWRHYNASLINYDDLVGYPLPDEQGKLRFVQTPASIWDAQVVFIDEISRCRPDMQNRLFPIIHEKRVQGMALDRLAHRWAAMNPPATDDDEDRDETSTSYAGSEPLDAALADRFNFVVEVPRWEKLSESNRKAVIRSKLEPVSPEVAQTLTRRIAQVREDLCSVELVLGDVVTEYVRLIADHLSTLGLPLSGRRASMLYRNILAVHAAGLLASPVQDPGDSAWLSLINSLPHRAEGRKIDQGRLLLAHNEAWKGAGLDAIDPRRMLVCERDPVRRAISALCMDNLTNQELSAYVADGLAEAAPGGRQALALFVLEQPSASKLIAAIAEQVAELSATVMVAQDVNQSLHSGSNQHRAWLECEETLSKLAASDPEKTQVSNLLSALFAKGEIQRPEDVPQVLREWRKVRDLTAGNLAQKGGAS